MLPKVKGSPKEWCLAELAETPFPVFRKASSKNCFQFKLSQHQVFKIFWEPKSPNYFRSAGSRAQSTPQLLQLPLGPQPWAGEGGFHSQMQQPRSAGLTGQPLWQSWTPAKLSHVFYEELGSLLWQRNTEILLSPSLNQGSEGFYTMSLILAVSGNLRSIAARGFTAACPKTLWRPSPRQL